MVDAARQMLDELMGRNRNLHPSEASRKVNWDDPEFCPFHIVQFCPHDLFVNTRADLGPCTRVHDDEAKRMFELARPCARKRYYEDEFLRFCNTMLNDVDRKIQKGKQRLQLMQRDQPKIAVPVHVSKYQEQLNNLNARIKKLLTEAEEAGIRGDVDQAQDLMTLCEQLKDEKDGIITHHENVGNNGSKDTLTYECPEATTSTPDDNTSGSNDGGNKLNLEKKAGPAWVQELNSMQEKQMEVCEVCGAFLIVGDAQQRIEDHLTGKQHLGYARLRNTVSEIHDRRMKEREEDERKRREERGTHKRSSHGYDNFDRKKDSRDGREPREYREHERHDREGSSRGSIDKHRHHHKSRRRSHSRNSSIRNHGHRHDSCERSRSRSRY